MADPTIEKVKLSDLVLDTHNANIGTERGRDMIADSIEEYGFAEAGTLDKHNTLIGGNKRTLAASGLGMEDALIIDTDGKTPVYIRRTDLDLSSADDPRARMLAYTLNRAAQISINLDPHVILADTQMAGLDLTKLFTPDELAAYLEPIVEASPDASIDDSFGTFGTVAPRDETVIPFKFGDYAGLVDHAVYNDFIEAYQRYQTDSMQPMMTDILRFWLRLDGQDLDNPS